MDTCFVYLVNSGYLVPAFVSASGARARAPANEADVIIFDIGAESAAGAACELACQEAGILYKRVSGDFLGGISIAYARLFLDELLPEHYRTIVYLDADSQVWGDFGELMRTEAPAGSVIAVRDPMVVALDSENAMGRYARAVMDELGFDLEKRRRYINSGFFKVERDTLKSFAPACIASARTEPQTRFTDQDLINREAGDRIVFASMRWNFPGFLLGSPLEALCPPRFTHFMSNPRPWHGPYPPWGVRGSKPYDELRLKWPELAAFTPTVGTLKGAKYVAQQIYKQMSVSPQWAGKDILAAFRASEADTIV